MDRGNVRFWDGKEMNLSIIFLVALQLTEYVCVLHEYPATCFAYVLLGSTLPSKRRTVHLIQCPSRTSNSGEIFHYILFLFGLYQPSFDLQPLNTVTSISASTQRENCIGLSSRRPMKRKKKSPVKPPQANFTPI